MRCSTRTRQVVLGNPQGDVTMVEFFDYNCGFCRKALADKIELIKDDPKLRLVLKEFPVLGEGSIAGGAGRRRGAHAGQDRRQEISRIPPEAVRQPRPDRQGARARGGPRDRVRRWPAPSKDMASDEVRQTLEESFKLAEALGINGTPTYVLGGQVVVGAVGVGEAPRGDQHRPLRQGHLLKPACESRQARPQSPLALAASPLRMRCL